MKIQYLAAIFVIIMLPISLVFSAFARNTNRYIKITGRL